MAIRFFYASRPRFFLAECLRNPVLVAGFFAMRFLALTFLLGYGKKEMTAFGRIRRRGSLTMRTRTKKVIVSLFLLVFFLALLIVAIMVIDNSRWGKNEQVFGKLEETLNGNMWRNKR